MEYIYRKNESTAYQWKDGQGLKWNCERKPDGEVFADVRKKNRLDTNDVLLNDKACIVVEPCKKKLGFFEKVAGYIPCSDKNGASGYIRIVKTAGKKIAATVIILLILLAGGILGLREMMKPGDDTPIRIASGEMTNPNPQNIRIPGIERVYVDAGDTHVQQLLLNVEGNAYNLQYTIELEDTGEVIYKSKVIQPGYGIREFDLTRTFEEGEYNILVTVNSSAREEEADSSEDAAYNAGQLEAILIVE
nr:hypothetical protein [uncultured Mediterraneibacter sp.]